MARTNYQRGRAFEYRVRDDMERRGYVSVRAPASKTPADVYCIGLDSKVFVQCKTDGRLSTAEWNRFYDYCLSVDAVPVMAAKGRGGRGISYWLITGRKARGGVRPMRAWEPPEGGRREVSTAERKRD